MKRVLAYIVSPLVLFLVAPRAHAVDLKPPPECRRAIDTRVPGWRLSPPPEELATYAKQKGLTTNVARADFDSDGTQDTAVLLVAPNAGTDRQYVAVCLTRDSKTRVYMIRDPYCGDGIDVARKGSRVYDYQTGKLVTYRTNGVSTYCFEKAGGTYLFENGRFTLVIDSD